MKNTHTPYTALRWTLDVNTDTHTHTHTHTHTLHRVKVDSGHEHTHLTIMLSDVILFCNMFV